MNYLHLTQQTLAQSTDALLKAQAAGELKKAIGVSTGLKGVNLEAPAHQLVPLMSPFRQTIPRKVLAGSDSVQWKDITALSSPKLGVAEEAAGALFSTTVVDRNAAYKFSALGGKVTRQAEAQSKGFDPALAKETMNTLLNAMKLEEQYMLGATNTALATPGAPTVTEVNGKGTIGAVTAFVRIAALNIPASMRGQIDRPADPDGGGDSLLAGRAVLAVDSQLGGVTVAGAEGNSGAMGGTDNAVKITWDPVPGAAAYAVYVGTATGAANVKCEAIVTQTSVTLTSLNTGGEAASALTGTSAEALTYDGILPQLVAGGSGAYVKNLNAVMTGSQGEVVAIQDAFQAIWDTAKIGKFRLQVAGVDSRILTRLGIAAGAGPTIQVDPSSPTRASFAQGFHVGSIMNAVTGDLCPVDVLPWLPGGTILILPTEIPYPDANVSSPIDMVFAYDWERWDYGSTRSTGPIWTFDVINMGVLRVLFSGGCGVIYNIHKG